MFFLRGVVESSRLWWWHEILNLQCFIESGKKRETAAKKKEKFDGRKEMQNSRVETINVCVVARIQWTFLSLSLASLSTSLENWRKLTYTKFPTERARKKYHNWLSYNIVKKVRAECLQVRETAGKKNFISLIENNSIFKSMDEVFPFIV